MKMKNSMFFPLVVFLIAECTISPLSNLGNLPVSTPLSKKSTDEAPSNSTVNVISQNAVESSENETQSFLDRLERKDSIRQIRKAISTLRSKLQNIQYQVQNKLNQINASGNCAILR